MKKIFKILLILNIIIVPITSGFSQTKKVLEDPNLAIQLLTEIYDDQGVKIGEYGDGGIPVNLSQLPPIIPKIILYAQNEKHFFGNTPSTQELLYSLTRKLIKNRHRKPDRSFAKKLAIDSFSNLAIKQYSQEELMKEFLTDAYFGNRSYGIIKAAFNYFRKTPQELSIAEISLLAGILENPSRIDIWNYLDRAKQRQKWVLERLLNNGVINETQFKNAWQEPLKIYLGMKTKEFNKKYLPDFTEHVLRTFRKDRYGNKKGYQIYTTANLKMGQAAKKQINKLIDFYQDEHYRGPLKTLSDEAEVENFLKWQISDLLNQEDQPLLTITPTESIQHRLSFDLLRKGQPYRAVILETGGNNIQIKIGNLKASFNPKIWTSQQKSMLRPKKKPQPIQFKKFDVIEVLYLGLSPKNEPKFSLYQTPNLETAVYAVQPFEGSIKVLVGSKDSQQGFNHATQLTQSPGTLLYALYYLAALKKGYQPGMKLSDTPVTFEIKPGLYWRMQNRNKKYLGEISLKEAILKQQNSAVANLFQNISPETTINFLKELGINHPTPKQISISAVLGEAGLKLSELTEAYGSLVLGGVRIEPYAIRKIVDQNGKVIFQHSPTLPKSAVRYPSQGQLEPADKQTISSSSAYSQQSARQVLDLMFTKAKELFPNSKNLFWAYPGRNSKDLSAWLIGMTPELTTGLWIGYDNSQKMILHYEAKQNYLLKLWEKVQMADPNHVVRLKRQELDWAYPSNEN